MIIELTFNDKEYTYVLVECLRNRGILGLEMEYTVRKQNSIDIDIVSSEYLEEFDKNSKFHSRFVKLLMKVKDSCISKSELGEFKDMLREVILDFLSDWNDYEYFSEQLEINFHESITDRSCNREKLYYFIPSESYIIL